MNGNDTSPIVKLLEGGNMSKESCMSLGKIKEIFQKKARNKSSLPVLSLIGPKMHCLN